MYDRRRARNPYEQQSPYPSAPPDLMAMGQAAAGPIMPPAASLTPNMGVPGFDASLQPAAPEWLPRPQAPAGGLTVPLPEPPAFFGEDGDLASTPADRQGGPVNQILAAFQKAARRGMQGQGGPAGPTQRPNMPMMHF